MSEPQMPPPPPFGAPAAPPPPPGSSGSGVSENRGLWIVLSYFFPLGLVPLLVEKNDPEVQWHAKHGLVLGVAWTAILIALTILGFMGPIGCIAWLAQMAVVVIALITSIVCIIKGLNGERFKVPVLSDFAEKL